MTEDLINKRKTEGNDGLMEIWAAIILTAGLLAVLVVVLICQKKNQDYRKKCIRAAQRIIREEYLDGSIMKGEIPGGFPEKQ